MKRERRCSVAKAVSLGLDGNLFQRWQIPEKPKTRKSVNQT